MIVGNQIDEKAVDAFLDDVVNELSRLWATNSSNDSQTNRETVLQEFQGILRNSLELEFVFLSSKAIINLDWNEPRKTNTVMIYYPFYMEECLDPGRKLCEDDCVDYAVSPLLLEFGNADGRDYNCELALAKSRVVCQ